MDKQDTGTNRHTDALGNDEGFHKPATEFQKSQEHGNSSVEEGGIGKGFEHMPSVYLCKFWVHVHFCPGLFLFDTIRFFLRQYINKAIFISGANKITKTQMSLLVNNVHRFRSETVLRGCND